MRWHLIDDAIVREYKSTDEPYRLDWAVELPLEPRPIRGRVSLAMTADLERGLAHFVAHAVLPEVSA